MEKTFPIVWGHVSIIEADLICMNRLIEQNKGKKQEKTLLRSQFRAVVIVTKKCPLRVYKNKHKKICHALKAYCAVKVHEICVIYLYFSRGKMKCC